jgi:hypothetical protein
VSCELWPWTSGATFLTKRSRHFLCLLNDFSHIFVCQRPEGSCWASWCTTASSIGAVKSCREFDWIQADLDDIDMEAQSRGRAFPEHRHLHHVDVYCSGSVTWKWRGADVHVQAPPCGDVQQIWLMMFLPWHNNLVAHTLQELEGDYGFPEPERWDFDHDPFKQYSILFKLYRVDFTADKVAENK